MAVVLAALSALVYGCADFCGGLATRRSPAAAVTVTSQVAGLIALLVLLPFVPSAGPSAHDLGIGALAGLAGGTGIMLLYRSLAKGTMSIVSPTTAVCAAVVPVGVGLALGERLGTVTAIGIGCALGAIVLVSLVRSEDGRGHGLDVIVGSLAAGCAFGLFFVLLAQAHDDAGLWPLLGARPASIALAALVARRSRPAMLVVPRAEWPMAAGAGVLDMGANALYLLASRGEQLAIVAVLAAMYPVSTVLLARLVGGEHLRPAQSIGLGLAAAALALISLR